MVRFSVLLLLILCMFASACGNQKIDTKAVKEEMKAREIKVIPESTILETAMKFGREAIQHFTFSIGDKSAIMPLSQFEGRDSKPTSKFTLFMGNPELSGKEKMIFDAYRYNTEHGISSEENIQNLEEENNLLYTAPIVSDSLVIGMWSIRLPRKMIVDSIEN